MVLIILLGSVAATACVVLGVSTLSGLAAHRIAFGINTLLVLVIVRHSDVRDVAGLGTVVLFAAAIHILEDL